MAKAKGLKQLQKYADIAVLGFGQTGLSVARFLLSHGIRPSLFDTREQPNNRDQMAALAADLPMFCGPLQLDDLLAMDLIIVSPGIDRSLFELQVALDAGIPMIGDIELFAWFTEHPVVAITGSNGKSTVTQLVGELLTAGGLNVAIGGNIGTPVLDLLNRDTEPDCYVLELSSFQLESTYSLAPIAATILNVSADHMDRYATLHDYSDAKQRIYEHASVLVVNADDSMTEPTSKLKDSEICRFSVRDSAAEFGLTRHQGSYWICHGGKRLLSSESLKIKGIHNMANVLAALALVKAAHIDIAEVVSALQQFQGLPHRCESVFERNGVVWVNDSKATNIGAACAAIEGLRPTTKGRLVLIAGGDGKGADFKSFANACAQVDALITFGKDGDRIADLRTDSVRVKDLQAAVTAAADAVGDQGIVLLSPACASLDMFKDYADRGHQFRAAVEAHYVAAAS